MSHHYFIELRIQAKYYSARCQERGLQVPFAPNLGDFEELTSFSRFWAEAEKLGVGKEEYLDLVVEQCARQKKKPPRHAKMSEDWVLELVKKAIYTRNLNKIAEIKHNQMMEEHTDELSMIQQLVRFDQLLRRSYEHMATKAFKPDGWKLIFTKRKGGSFAKSLAERRLVPEVFKYLSSSWRNGFPDDVPEIEVSGPVIQRFDELFPGDLASSVCR
jgi:hypothetical protein